jgi:hypothetical protein
MVSIFKMNFSEATATFMMVSSCILSFSFCVHAEGVKDYSYQSNDACKSGEFFGCVSEVLTESLQCRDLNVCSDLYNCDETQAAYRSGQLCQSFPFYNGGYPMGDER